MSSDLASVAPPAPAVQGADPAIALAQQVKARRLAEQVKARRSGGTLVKAAETTPTTVSTAAWGSGKQAATTRRPGVRAAMLDAGPEAERLAQESIALPRTPLEIGRAIGWSPEKEIAEAAVQSAPGAGAVQAFFANLHEKKDPSWDRAASRAIEATASIASAPIDIMFPPAKLLLPTVMKPFQTVGRKVQEKTGSEALGKLTEVGLPALLTAGLAKGAKSVASEVGAVRGVRPNLAELEARAPTPEIRGTPIPEPAPVNARVGLPRSPIRALPEQASPGNYPGVLLDAEGKPTQGVPPRAQVDIEPLRAPQAQTPVEAPSGATGASGTPEGPAGPVAPAGAPSAPQGPSGGLPSGAAAPFGDRTPQKMSPAYALDRNIDTLKRYGPEGEELAHRVRAVRDEVRDNSAAFHSDLAALKRTLTSADVRFLRENGLKLMERRMTPPNPRIAAAVEWWNGSQGRATEIGRIVNESGSFINDPRTGPRKITLGRPDYGPHVYKGEFLELAKAGDPRALSYVDQMVGKGKQFRSRAEALDALMYQRDRALKPFNPGTESPRRILRPPDDVLEQDFFKLVEGHALRAFRSAAEHRQFQYLDPETGAPRNTNPGGGPQGDLGDLIARIGQKRGPADAAAVEAKAMDLLERNVLDRSSVSRLQHKIGAGAGAVNALRYYTRPTSWLKNITQVPTIYGFVGEGPFAEAVAKFTTQYNKTRQTGLRTGAFDPYGHFGETAGVVERAIGGEGASLGQRVTNAAMLPFDVFDRQGRMIATAAAEPFAKSLQKALNGSNQSYQTAMGKLKAMDLPPDLIDRLKNNAMTPEDMRRFTRELVDLTNVRVDRARRIPGSAASGLDRQLSYQGKNFGIEQTRSFKRTAVDQLRVGNPLPMIRLLGASGMVSYGLIKAFGALTGTSSRSEVTPRNLVREAGSLGAAGDVLSSLVPDEEGKTRLKSQIEFMQQDQFDSLIKELGSLGDKLKAPPTEDARTVEGVTYEKKRSRWDVLLDSLRRLAPAAAEWEKIENKYIGDKSISYKAEMELRRKAANKAEKVEVEVK